MPKPSCSGIFAQFQSAAFVILKKVPNGNVTAFFKDCILLFPGNNTFDIFILILDKNDTFFNEIDDLEKSRQVWKVFLVFRAENVLFLCCGKARETKENVFNEVVYIFRGFSGFPKAQKQHI